MKRILSLLCALTLCLTARAEPRCTLPELPGVLGSQVNIADWRHEMKTIFRASFQQIFERLHRFSVLLCRKFFTVKFRRQFSAHQLCGRCLPS